MPTVTLIFTLTMPGRNTWNGRWSGDGTPYIKTRRVTDSLAKRILSESPYFHRWNDGWTACVSVRKSSGSSDTRKVRAQSQGFCGYEWMISNILTYGNTEKPEV